MRKSEPPPPVQFRLDPKTHKRLTQLAEAYELSPGQLARRIVTEYLEDAERLRIREKLTAIEGEQKKLRDDLAASIYALLVFAGERPEDEARGWVEKNLKQS